MRTLLRACSRVFSISFVVLFFAADARAAVTSLLLTGDPGDYISGGQTLFFAPADGPFSARTNYSNGVSLAFHTPTYSHFWYLDFAAPNKQFLTPGMYSGAVRFPFQAIGQSALSVYGDGRGCNTLTGSFEIKEVVYGPGATGTDGSVISFRATFEQHCEGWAAAARGEIRYNATVPIEMTAPASVTAFERQSISVPVRAVDALGGHVTLSATGVPAGAAFVDNGDNTGTLSWLPTEGQAGAYNLVFRGDDGAGNIGTTFTTITVIAAPPLNDDFGVPIVIGGVPFTNTQTTTKATTAADDPFCAAASHTVWYAFTPAADMRVEINTFGSDYDTTLSVHTGTRGALTQIACNDNSGGASQSRVRFDAVAGVTYWVMAASYYYSSGGHLVLNVLPAPPPLSIGLAVTGAGGVDPTNGQATIVGSITCSRPVLAAISGQLKQDHAQSSLTGQFALVVPCDGTTDWTATIVIAPTLFEGRAVSLFVGGRADVTASATALDHDTGERAESNAATRIVLRGGMR
jgi:hypothetical protein